MTVARRLSVLAPPRSSRSPLQGLAAAPVDYRAVVDLLVQEHCPVHAWKLPLRLDRSQPGGSPGRFVRIGRC